MDHHVPDFRKMSPDEIKENISALNKLIRDTKRAHAKNQKVFFALSGAGVAGTAAAVVFFPPALIFMAAFTGAAMGESGARAASTSQVLAYAEETRDRLKTLYRARPGRKQFNLAARRARETERRARNNKNKYPHGFRGGI